MNLHLRRETPRWIPPMLCIALVFGHLACSPSVAADESAEIVQLLRLSPGAVVADVGAGDGEWTFELAAAVGGRGKVWATEVTEDLVADLAESAKGEGLDQVRVVLGDDQDTGLPTGCCDAVLLRMVYHHFSDPVAMRSSLRRALRPDGRLLIIDIAPQSDWGELDDVPDRGGHGISLDDLVEEMTGDGFREVSRKLSWNDDEERYAVLFEPST